MKLIIQLAIYLALLAPAILFAARPSITDLQQQINQLQAQVNQLQSLPHDRIEVLDNDGNLLGLSVPLPSHTPSQVTSKLEMPFIYNKVADIFFVLQFRHVFNDVDVDLYYPALFDIYFESFDCTGQAYLYNGITEFAGTQNVLVANGQPTIRFFLTAPHNLVEDRIYSYQSMLDKNNGVCHQSHPGTDKPFRVTPVIEVANPLPFSFPVKPPLRFEYVGQ